jgi:hypothetical protein
LNWLDSGVNSRDKIGETIMAAWKDLDLGKSAEQLLSERGKRLNDAMAMRQPDRIPLLLGLGYLQCEMAGISRQESYDNFEKGQGALEKAALYFQPDAAYGTWGAPGPSAALGDQMTKWPGYGLSENESFQFTEQEFMKAEDYDEFLFDPSDWSLRKYLPRAFSKLGAFADLPPFGMLAFGYYHTMNLLSYGTPAVVESLQAIGKAIQAQSKLFEDMMKSMERMAALGFPFADLMNGSLIYAPFDFMSDTLRGMRGIMLDMLKRPDKLLAAQEKALKIQVEFAIQWSQQNGLPFVQIPLHRGSDGFMSLKQFEKFYWPQLKSMILQLVDHGIKPIVFYEGIWDQRLDYLAELPEGKTFGMFQSSDIFKVKEKLGNVMCISGGMPNSLLNGASVDEIRAYTKKVCEVVGKDGGFIMTTAIGELEGSDPKLVKVWVDATKEFGVY